MAPIQFYITDRFKAIHRLWFKLLYVLVFDFFVMFAPYVRFHYNILNTRGALPWYKKKSSFYKKNLKSSQSQRQHKTSSYQLFKINDVVS